MKALCFQSVSQLQPGIQTFKSDAVVEQANIKYKERYIPTFRL